MTDTPSTSASDPGKPARKPGAKSVAAKPRTRSAATPAPKPARKKVAAVPTKAPKAPKSRDATKAGKPAAPKIKTKLVRDSFTIPKTEYAVLGGLKDRALSLARHVKKSELLRAGIAALNAMSDKALLDALDRVPSLKTGRPSQQPGTSAPPA